MQRTALFEGLVLIALGVTSIVESLRLKDDWQGAKLMPAVIGVVLVLLGVAHFVVKTDPGAWPGRAAGRRVLLMFAVLVVYVTIMPSTGFLLATAVLSLVLVRALGEYSWPMTVVCTVAIAVASHVVFKHWLGMPLPGGPFG